MLTSFPTDDCSQESTVGSIVIIDDETLTQDCMVISMRKEFPHSKICGVTSIRDLHRQHGLSIEAVLLKIKPQSYNLYDLAPDIRRIEQGTGKAPVIVICPSEDAASIEAVVAAGAQGLIPVAASFKVAVAALRLVLAGSTYYPRPAVSKFELNDDMLGSKEEMIGIIPANASPQLTRISSTTGIESLTVEEAGILEATFTAREVDVLMALQQGRSNKWIAHRLELSENTIKVHIRHIMRKLHATNRTEAAILSQKLVGSGGSSKCVGRGA